MDQNFPDTPPRTNGAVRQAEPTNAFMAVAKPIWGGIVLGLIGLALGGPLCSLAGTIVGGLAAPFINNDFLMKTKHQLRM